MGFHILTLYETDCLSENTIEVLLNIQNYIRCNLLIDCFYVHMDFILKHIHVLYQYIWIKNIELTMRVYS